MITIFGLVIGLGGILLGNIIEGGHTGSLMQGAAALIVLSGTIGAVMVSSRKQDFLLGLKMFSNAFRDDFPNRIQKVYSETMECVRLSRKESILALEPRINQVSHPFLKQILRVAVDGVDPQIVRVTFEKQIELQEEKMNSAAKIWMDAGGFAPTVGIIGAVLGLIHVMANLTDTAKLGAGIATAFVATIYGVAFANLIFIPIGNKLKKKIAEEMMLLEMILEGVQAIQTGLSPLVTEERLRIYLENEQQSKKK